MSEETLRQQKVAEVATEANRPIEVGKQSLETSLSKLSKFGGMNLLKRILPDAERLDSRVKTEKEKFLTNSSFADRRKGLAKNIEKWLSLLEEDKNVVELAEICHQKQEEYKELFSENLAIALDAIKPLEIEYRTLDTFFKNSGEEKLSNLRIVNVNKAELDDSNSEFIQEIDNLLKTAYDRLSLKDSYSILAMPGYIFKDKQILSLWAKMAKKYKVMLVSDHDDESHYDDLIKNISDNNYSDSDSELQNVILCCNWILGRAAETIAGEEEGLYLPPSGALAGMLYDKSVSIAQGRAGKKYGTLSEVKGCRLDLLVSEMKPIENQHIVPMVFSEGRVMAFNGDSLFNGIPESMQQYSVVRVYEWIKKVLIHYLYEKVHENWTSLVANDLETNISKFLNNHKGPLKLFEKFELTKPTRNANGEISMEITLSPHFAAKDFIVELKTDPDRNEKTNVREK